MCVFLFQSRSPVPQNSDSEYQNDLNKEMQKNSAIQTKDNKMSASNQIVPNKSDTFEAASDSVESISSPVDEAVAPVSQQLANNKDQTDNESVVAKSVTDCDESGKTADTDKTGGDESDVLDSGIKLAEKNS